MIDFDAGTFVVSYDDVPFKSCGYDLSALGRYMKDNGVAFTDMTEEEKAKFRTQ